MTEGISSACPHPTHEDSNNRSRNANNNNYLIRITSSMNHDTENYPIEQLNFIEMHYICLSFTLVLCSQFDLKHIIISIHIELRMLLYDHNIICRKSIIWPWNQLLRWKNGCWGQKVRCRLPLNFNLVNPEHFLLQGTNFSNVTSDSAWHFILSC